MSVEASHHLYMVSSKPAIYSESEFFLKKAKLNKVVPASQEAEIGASLECRSEGQPGQQSEAPSTEGETSKQKTSTAYF